MLVVITYDVDFTSDSGAKRLRKVAKICENYGVRVQKSVFELLIDLSQLVLIESQLLNIIDAELDSVRIYKIGNNWDNKVKKLGKKNIIEYGESFIL